MNGGFQAAETRPRRRDALAPVGRETVNARVFAELRRSLIHGVFEAGEVLRIVDLAETLQTSTMPVRDGWRPDQSVACPGAVSVLA